MYTQARYKGHIRGGTNNGVRRERKVERRGEKDREMGEKERNRKIE